MKIILGLAVVGMIAGVSAPAAADPYSYYRSRIDFTHAPTGYEVSGRRTASGVLYLKGENPDTGKTFALRVSRKGHITGTWEGTSVDRWVGGEDAPQVLAQRDPG
ncbi:hypothetical protein [Sphingosinicella microcystinivorans]|uniref:hypothetical protein n=1 Tax=Sphingosinicella microcystinivorans TaxID=335406 RepID=UPI0022F3EF5B|nr:hypothetical protein [Sphingosinicella microcystinivorans]WBX86099.1 hypothetical protein PE061_09385 [Sphingosinicella microcystinivorans]